jgi:HSP20 family protein
MTEKNDKQKSRKTEGTEGSTALAVPGLGFPGDIFQNFMKPFDEFMAPLFSGSTGSLWSQLGEKQPTVEFQDRGDHFRLMAELPGFDKKEVEVRVGSNAIELSAEKRSQEKAKDKNTSRSTYSYFHRYLTLPEKVLSEKVDGTMKNGILELKLPKSEPKAKDNSRRVHLN